ncbi:hypothetical protein DFS33DRAFT_1277761 [Desarmillaria ectypa]|nr:hypothetical protein DFS33DRAFT_1277761 [Desarmillaria ectypa]
MYIQLFCCVAKTQKAGLLVSTIDYVTNVVEKHHDAPEKIMVSLAGLVPANERDTVTIFDESLAQECLRISWTHKSQLWTETWRRVIGRIFANILTAGGIGFFLSGPFLPAKFEGILSASFLWSIIIIPISFSFLSLRLLRRLERAAAAVCGKVYIFVGAGIALSGWFKSLSQVSGGTPDRRSKILAAISNLNKFRAIFSSRLECLFNTRDNFGDDYQISSDLPSHPLPAASETPPHQITHTRDSAASSTNLRPPSVASLLETVKQSSDDHAMRAVPSSSQTVSGAVKTSSSSGSLHIERNQYPDHSESASESGSNSQIIPDGSYAAPYTKET